ncbi:MAG: hypothetical protein GX602_00175 [Dehalococcoidales bacterium]|nr:hypothetical protein [Dehalococcoidales bacterium]
MDNIDNLQLTDELETRSFNELHSLKYLSEGLWFLYHQVIKLEKQVTDNIGDGRSCFICGNAPQLYKIPQGLVACAFHWYSVSVCNYVRLVGWLGNDNDPKKAKDYLERVLPEVYLWRNKIGAHFAITDPYKDDSEADLKTSTIFPLSFEDNAFYASSLILSLNSKGKSSTSRQDMRWSLTKTHQMLTLRYWPDKFQG